MEWELRESHRVGGYAFCWFGRDGEWVVAIWKAGEEPERPIADDFRRALTVHHVSREENPSGDMKRLRQFCERFLNDIPFRVRAIRNKIPTLDALERSRPVGS
jgi:hypothetical protein